MFLMQVTKGSHGSSYKQKMIPIPRATRLHPQLMPAAEQGITKYLQVRRTYHSTGQRDLTVAAEHDFQESGHIHISNTSPLRSSV